jgi:hypothetical protein
VRPDPWCLWPTLSLVAFCFHPLVGLALLFAALAAYAAWRTVRGAYAGLPPLARAVRSPAGIGFAALALLPAAGSLHLVPLAWCALAVGLAGLALGLHRGCRSGAVQRALYALGAGPLLGAQLPPQERTFWD